MTFGKNQNQRFQTAAKADGPGIDVQNPTFDQAFRIPLTTADLAKPENFRIALMNGEKEVGAADIAYTDVVNAPDMTLQNSFDVGDGATVRASICLRGVVPGGMQKEVLPSRDAEGAAAQ